LNDLWAYLTDDDRVLVRRFILASGSLKEVAASYEISYPTMRLRLDRLIEKIKVLESVERLGPFERVVRAQQAAGKIDPATAALLLEAHRKENETG
jgi:hypothetical protein